MSAVVTMKQLLEAGVHFGHQTRRWNPKMKRFIHGDRGGIYLIDLRQTLEGIEKAYTFVRDLVADGGTILFIGTKKQAQDSIEGYAQKCGMPYINQRWLGGMLTNFETISKRVQKMKEYQRMRDSGEFDVMPKKEALLLSRELDKLEPLLGAVRDAARPPPPHSFPPWRRARAFAALPGRGAGRAPAVACDRASRRATRPKRGPGASPTIPSWRQPRGRHRASAGRWRGTPHRGGGSPRQRAPPSRRRARWPRPIATSAASRALPGRPRATRTCTRPPADYSAKSAATCPSP